MIRFIQLETRSNWLELYPDRRLVGFLWVGRHLFAAPKTCVVVVEMLSNGGAVILASELIRLGSTGSSILRWWPSFA
jgi:hypothetical protein